MIQKASAASEDPLGSRLVLERQLCFALYSASLAMTKLYRPLLEPLGLTLSAVSGHDAALGAGWSLPVGVERSTSLGFRHAHAFNQATREGRAGRKGARHCRRARVRITLTQVGKRLKKQAESVPQSAANATGCELSDLDGLTEKITKLRASIEARTRFWQSITV